MLTLNLIRKTLHTICFEGTPRTKINARDCIVEWCSKNNPKKKKILFKI